MKRKNHPYGADYLEVEKKVAKAVVVIVIVIQVIVMKNRAKHNKIKVNYKRESN